MKATLLPKYVDPIAPKGMERKVNLEIVPVVDVEKNEWRSFRIDSVISFEMEKQNGI